ncbi:MAG: hypothetical protein EZS28_037460, partial [Streblomastix strix]
MISRLEDPYTSEYVDAYRDWRNYSPLRKKKWVPQRPNSTLHFRKPVPINERRRWIPPPCRTSKDDQHADVDFMKNRGYIFQRQGQQSASCPYQQREQLGPRIAKRKTRAEISARYKTELCRNFMESKFCPYGD